MADPVADWNTAKAEYKALTNEHKPKEKSMGIFETGHTGLSKSIEKAYEYQRQPNAKAKNFQEYFDSFSKAADSYCKLLQKALDDEKGVLNLKTDKYRGLKMLKAKLDGYKAAFKLDLQQLQDRESRLGANEQIQTQAMAGVTKSIAGYKAAEKTIKAIATVAVYDREMQTGEAVRKLATALRSFQMVEANYKKQNMNAPDILKKQFGDATKFITLLTPWASGNKMTLPVTTTKDGVLQELKSATTIVKGCADAFGIAW